MTSMTVRQRQQRLTFLVILLALLLLVPFLMPLLNFGQFTPAGYTLYALLLLAVGLPLLAQARALRHKHGAAPQRS